VCVCVCACVCMYIDIYRHIHVCVYVCVCVMFNAAADPDNSEERKGCSGRVGKMIFSAGVKQLAIVAYVRYMYIYTHI